MTTTLPEQDTTALLARLDLDADMLSDGDLEVRTPITGEPIARIHSTTAEQAEAAIARSSEAFLAWRDCPPHGGASWCGCWARSCAREKEALGALVTLESRQDRSGGARRGAGDDRHLRLRGRPLAPALRPHHRVGAARPPDDGDMAPARRGRRHHGLQLPGRGLELELGAGAVCGDPVSGSRRAQRRSPRWPCQALFRRAAERFGDAPEGLLEVLIFGAWPARAGGRSSDSARSATGSTAMGGAIGTAGGGSARPLAARAGRQQHDDRHPQRPRRAATRIRLGRLLWARVRMGLRAGAGQMATAATRPGRGGGSAVQPAASSAGSRGAGRWAPVRWGTARSSRSR